MIKSLTLLDGIEYRLAVQMDIPANSDYSLIPGTSSDPKTQLFYAQLEGGSLSGIVIRDKDFDRAPGAERVKVIARNDHGDDEGEDIFDFPG